MPFKGSTAKSKRAIYLLWMHHPQSHIKSSFEITRDPNWRPLWGGENVPAIKIYKMCGDFVRNVVKQAMDVDFPNDVVIVNIGGLGDSGIRFRTIDYGRDIDMMDPATTSHWKKLVEEGIANTLADGTAGKSIKSPDEARKISIKYISMRTYLKEYDWKGVFTDKEVERWLYPTYPTARNSAEYWLKKRAAMY